MFVRGMGKEGRGEGGDQPPQPAEPNTCVCASDTSAMTVAEVGIPVLRNTDRSPHLLKDSDLNRSREITHRKGELSFLRISGLPLPVPGTFVCFSVKSPPGVQYVQPKNAAVHRLVHSSRPWYI